MRADGVVTINGRVHAICYATRKPTLYQVFTDHFEKCSKCKVYTDTQAWEDDQTRIIFTKGLEGTVVCGVSCARCVGYTGRLFHSVGSKIPKPQHMGWPGV